MKKIVEGSFTLNPSPMRVKDVLLKLKPLVEFPAKIKGLSLSIDALSAFKRVELDERRLTQVLLNLTSNAVKYTSTGYINVIAKDNLGTLEIIVNDTGIGIRPEHMQEIFKMFGLADAKNELTGTGVGMGLYLSKYIINKMDGTLTVTSEVHKGTTVRIEIPLMHRYLADSDRSIEDCSCLHIPEEIFTVIIFI